MDALLSLIASFVGFVVGIISAATGFWYAPPVDIQLKPIEAPTAASTSSSTPEKVAETLPPKATSTPKSKVVPKPLRVVSTPLPVATPPTALPVPPVPISYRPVEEVNQEIRKSLVNILCTTQGGGSFQPLSGSGIIVSKKGVILTNAHIGQFFLLRDYPRPNNIVCTIRTGSPAVNTYTAKLLYLPPSWVQVNASQITKDGGTGTGEDDYAFLLITGRTNGEPLPTEFPAALITTDTPSLNEPIVLAAYPAQFLGGTSIQNNLHVGSAASTVQKLYTFDEGRGPVDVISVGSPIIAQSGSSGGSVARLLDGALVALIATATAGNSTNSRDLHAITLAHVDRSLTKSGKGGFVPFLTGDLAQKYADFSIIAPALTKQLVDALR